MAFKVTKWEYSNEVSTNYNYILPDEGDCYAKIVDAKFDEEGDQYGPKYTLTLLDLQKEGYFILDYRPNGSGKPAAAHRGTLISLGEALAGVSIGRPEPGDVVGGVVIAEITHKAGNTKTYPRCYHFRPAPQDLVEGFSEIDQYYEGSEDTSLVEKP